MQRETREDKRRVRKGERGLSFSSFFLRTCWRRDRERKRAPAAAAPRRVNYADAACGVGDDRRPLINDIDPGRLPSIDTQCRWKH